MKKLPSSPPAWLKGHPTALMAWRQFTLRRAEAPIGTADQRQIDLLAHYCELIDNIVSGKSSGMAETARRMSALTTRDASEHFNTPQEFRAAFRKTLAAARVVNNNQARVAQLAQAFGVELEEHARNTIPGFRNLVRAILPVGQFVLAGKSKLSSGQKVQITYNDQTERIRKNVTFR